MEENLTNGNELFIVNKKTKWVNVYLIALTVLSIAISFVCFGGFNQTNLAKGNQALNSGDEIYSKQLDEISGEIFLDNKSGEDESKEEEIVMPHVEIPSSETERYIDPTKPMVALTFDDGPHPKNTLKLIEIFENNNSRASFFDIGKEMGKYPDIVKAEVEAGFDVGGHTYSHVSLNNLSDEKVLSEVNETKEAFKNATGLDLKYIRAPYGEANSATRKNIDVPLIHWNVDAEDWKLRDSNKIIEKISAIENLDGKIILMHATYDWTVKAIEQLVPELIEKGYQLVTVSEMAEAKQKSDLANGKIYYGF